MNDLDALLRDAATTGEDGNPDPEGLGRRLDRVDRVRRLSQIATAAAVVVVLGASLAVLGGDRERTSDLDVSSDPVPPSEAIRPPSDVDSEERSENEGPPKATAPSTTGRSLPSEQNPSTSLPGDPGTEAGGSAPGEDEQTTPTTSETRPPGTAPETTCPPATTPPTTPSSTSTTAAPTIPLTVEVYDFREHETPPWIKLRGTAPPGSTVTATSPYGSRTVTADAAGTYTELKVVFEMPVPPTGTFQLRVTTSGSTEEVVVPFTYSP